MPWRREMTPFIPSWRNFSRIASRWANAPDIRPFVCLVCSRIPDNRPDIWFSERPVTSVGNPAKYWGKKLSSTEKCSCAVVYSLQFMRREFGKIVRCIFLQKLPGIRRGRISGIELYIIARQEKKAPAYLNMYTIKPNSNCYLKIF